MYSYISVLWDSGNQNEEVVALDLVRRLRRTEKRWACVTEAAGVFVFESGTRSAGPRAHILASDLGVVVGDLFGGGGDKFTPINGSISPAESQAIVDSSTQRLCDRYWGSYVAFVRDPSSRRVLVLRDPTGAMPCFYAAVSGLRIFFSWLPDIMAIIDRPLTINWKYVTARLVDDQLSIRDTGLQEVSELLPGECFELRSPTESSRFRWDPASVALDAPIKNQVAAEEALRTVTADCVMSRAAAYDSIVVELSGGLDSAIVLGTLCGRSSKRSIVSLNLRTPEAESDERIYARAAAKQSKSELVELLVDPKDFSISNALRTPALPKPTIYALACAFDEAYLRVARDHGASAFFAGQGGDHIFLQTQSAMIAADYAYLHGARFGLARVAYDAAILSRRPIWTVLRTAFTFGLMNRGASSRTLSAAEGITSSCQISRDAYQSLDWDYMTHPWLRDRRNVPPAKFLQIASLIGLQSYYWPIGRAEHVDVVYPLVSQPLIEACLRVPSYILSGGGRDRCLARDAFSTCVPREIIERGTKGGVTTYYNAVIKDSIELIRSLLMDGMLVKEGILDRAYLEQALSIREIMRGEAVATLMEYISIEAWLQSWESSRFRAAA